MNRNIADFIRTRWAAGCDIVMLCTDEIAYVKNQLRQLPKQFAENEATKDMVPEILFHDRISGLHQAFASVTSPSDGTADPMVALQNMFAVGSSTVSSKVVSPAKPAILVMVDADHDLERTDDPSVPQFIKNIISSRMHSDTYLKGRGQRMVVLLVRRATPFPNLPEIKPFLVPLPTADDLETVVDSVFRPMERAKSIPATSPEHRRELAESLIGLTAFRAEEILSLAFRHGTERGKGITNIAAIKAAIEGEKEADINSIPGLQYIPKDRLPQEPLPGYEKMVDMLMQSRRLSVEMCRRHRINRVGAVCIAGVPGTGKTLAAMSAASPAVLDRILILWNLGETQGSFVGESERNARRALQVVTSLGAVCLLDDIDKAGMGAASSGHTGDGGTFSRIVQMLLTELGRGTDAVFMLTLNRVQNVPPELLRKGRMDAQFVVVYPDKETRERIIHYHLRHHAVTMDKVSVAMIASETDQWTGAEIAHLVRVAVRKAVADGKDVLDHAAMEADVAATVPMSRQPACASDLRSMIKLCHGFDPIGDMQSARTQIDSLLKPEACRPLAL